MDYFHRAERKDIGIGGYKCWCCSPPPKFRKKIRRMARRRDKMVVRQLIK